MATYLITSKASVDMGEYEGETPAEALLACHRAAGYGERDVWLNADGTDLEFGDDDYRHLCGGVDDWHIAPVERDDA